jgi:antitoxin ParD1/3/4
MGKVEAICLGDHLGRFLDNQVDAGRYENASEVVRAALRLLEENEVRLTALGAALEDGEERGPAFPFDMEAFIAAKRVES